MLSQWELVARLLLASAKLSGQPCVRISGKESGPAPYSTMKCGRVPSTSVWKCLNRFRAASWARQS